MSASRNRSYTHEPDWSLIRRDSANLEFLYQTAMNWCRTEISIAELREHTRVWMLEQDLSWHHYEQAPDWCFTTVGRMAAILNQGGEIPERSAVWMQHQLERIRGKWNKPEDLDQAEPELTAYQRTVIQYVNLYSVIDQLNVKYCEQPEQLAVQVKTLLNTQQPRVNLLKQLYRHYREDFTSATRHRDDEPYENYAECMMIVCNILAERTGNAGVKSQRKKKLTAAQSARAQKVNIKNYDTGLGMTGQDAGVIVGAKTAVVYNTRTKRIGIYTATANSTLDLQGNGLDASA